MKSDEQIAEEVLLRTLVEVRTARRRRRGLKIALASSAALMAGLAFSPRQTALPESGRQRVVTAAEDPAASDETLAVMVWRDGATRLEWVRTEDLGAIELQFSLEPVFAFADEDDL